MKYDFIYDSSKMSGEREYPMERDRFDSPIIPVVILFRQENVYLEADADGNAVFRNLDGVELFRDKADGQGRYFFGCYCNVKDGALSVRFPIQEIIDHYPNCDGEYDRYSYITRDNVVIQYKL
ncbi:MAG: hypothetical protein II272_03055 [Oscillospiraceae bacterium]|jgi:hypothetical protein|nr:hypothetical protein [Oscillospiraceae bacterium]